MLFNFLVYFFDHAWRDIRCVDGMTYTGKMDRVYPGTGIEFKDGSMRRQKPANMGIDLLTKCALDCFEVGCGDRWIRHRLNSIVVTGKSEPSKQEYGKPWTQFFSGR